MSSGQTPGKLSEKDFGRSSRGDLARDSKYDEGANRVHTKDLSSEGIAMNMNDPPGHMCKWFGEVAYDESGLGLM